MAESKRSKASTGQMPPSRKRKFGESGFEQWGGYMNAKITKLEEQFNEETKKLDSSEKLSKIFEGVSIFVNGYTEPSTDDLRLLMLLHGGVYHHYHRTGKTTHIIASNLPNSKMGQLKTMKIVKPEWITASIEAKKLLDYKKFLLFANESPLQAGLKFQPQKSNGSPNKGTALPSTSTKGLAKTAVDAQFLTEFYNNSRLHHLSTMGAMFKQYVGELKEKHNGGFPGRKRLMEWKESLVDNGPDEELEKVIMHIDMDCFFVSVALRNHPELRGQPVAVAHAKGNPTHQRAGVDQKFEYEFYKKKMEPKLGKKDSDSSESEEEQPGKKKWYEELSSRSEIASCSYEARKAGLRNGMYLGSALRLCPNLKTVPYDFDGYKEVSYTLYNTIAEFTLDIEAVSCDELFVDLASLIHEVKIKPLDFVSFLRKEIREKTGCPSSAGLGSNKLQARLATKRAKPDGQFHLTPLILQRFMAEVDVYDLPGVGRSLNYKMKMLNVKTCQDLQNISIEVLKREFGGKTGETLHKHCRGIDDRNVVSSHERKSVSAEVNYGIRFTNNDEALTFFKQLSTEVSNRLKEIKKRGKCVTLKLMVRAKDAPVETAKFLGHGACDYSTRSISLPAATDDPALIAKQVISIYNQQSIVPSELRGIGIQITKLEDCKKTSTSLQSFLKSKTEVPKNNSVAPKPSKPAPEKLQLPPCSQLDPEVLDQLPEEIRLEILNEYGVSALKEKPKPDAAIPSTSNALTLSQIDQEVWEELPKELQQEIKKDLTCKNVFNGLSVKDLRTMIREWVTSETEPQSCDVDMLGNHVRDLVTKKKLDDVKIITNCLHRHILEVRRHQWHWREAYGSIANQIQREMRQIFGMILKIENFN